MQTKHVVGDFLLLLLLFLTFYFVPSRRTSLSTSITLTPATY